MAEQLDHVGAALNSTVPACLGNQVKQHTTRVLLVGYSGKIRGGITGVTKTLLAHMPNVELFESLRYYRPLYKQILFTVGAYLRFSKRLVLDRPQVVHVLIGSRFDLVRNSFYILLSRLLNVPVIVGFRTNRDAMFSGFPERLRSLFSWVLSLADAFCFLSPRLQREMGDYVRKAGIVAVIPNPIPASYLELPSLPSDKRDGNLLFLGRWMKEKGADDLSQAMRELWRVDGVQCVCYGDVSSKIPVEGCVFGGWIEGDVKLKALREAVVLLLPSHAEAYPNVLVEAAACGTPFVATRIGGVPDIAATSGGGIVCDVGDVAGIVDAVRSLTSNATVWQACSESGRRWAEQCTIHDVVAKWQALYSKLGNEGTSD